MSIYGIKSNELFLIDIKKENNLKKIHKSTFDPHENIF